MLPTNQKAINKNQIVFNKEINNLYISNKDIYKEDWNKLCTPHLISPQHLYITSDEEIKVGDWIINILSNEIYKANEINVFKANQYKHNKKIIATTDTSLKTIISPYSNILDGKGIVYQSRDFYLSQPSQQFIEKYIEEYNKGNIITDVLVEYEEYISNKQAFDTGCGDFIYEEDIKPKVNPKDNTITIKKVKDNWTKEELTDVLKVFCNDYGILTSVDAWIKENL